MPQDMKITDQAERLVITLPKLADAEEYAKRLGFTFRILRTGYLRFPKSYWLEVCERVIGPWAAEQESRRKLSVEFFNIFNVQHGDRARIDFSTPRPFSRFSLRHHWARSMST